MATPVPLDKPVTLDFQSLTPVAKPKKTWGPIAPVKAQPIVTKRPETTVKPTPQKTAGKTGKSTTTPNTISMSCMNGLVVDKNDEVMNLLQSTSRTMQAAKKVGCLTWYLGQTAPSQPATQPVIDFSNLPTLGSAVKSKGRKK